MSSAPVARRLGIAAWFGLAAGFGEALSWIIRRPVRGELTHFSRDQAWMAPLTDVILFLALGLILEFALGVLPERWRWRGFIFVLTVAATAAIFLVWPQISRWATWLMALGIGVRVSQLLTQREANVRNAVRRSIVPLAAAVLLIGLSFPTARFFAERRALAALPAPKPGAPNVLLLIWDTTRRQNVSAYGYRRPTTPVFDSLARVGTLFGHAIATTSWTLPSHASMFTGLWPHEHGANWHDPLDSRHPVIAQVFDSSGYRTGGFVGNQYYCGNEFGLTRGFSHFVDYRVTPGEIFYNASFGRALSDWTWPHNIAGSWNAMGHNTAGDVNSEFLRWLDRGSDRPFLAFLNYFDAHAPRVVPAPFDAKFGNPEARPMHRMLYANHDAEVGGWPSFPPSLMQTEIDAYDASIAYMDRETGTLLEALRQRGLLANTIVIITADHGEAFGERSVGGHGTNLYRETIEVPLMILAPDQLPAGSVVNNPVTLRDIAQTTIDLAGIRDPFGLPGRSLRLQASGSATADTLLSELRAQPGRRAKLPKIGTGMASIVFDGWHYIGNGDGSEELYRLTEDPAQAVDLINDPGSASILPMLRETLGAVRR